MRKKKILWFNIGKKLVCSLYLGEKFNALKQYIFWKVCALKGAMRNSLHCILRIYYLNGPILYILGYDFGCSVSGLLLCRGKKLPQYIMYD